MKTRKKTELTYEQAMTRLEDIIRALEKGEVPLDEALGLYEEGTGLVRNCSSQLEEAETRIKILTRNLDGEPELEPDAAAEEV